jgi:hypothetical protein
MDLSVLSVTATGVTLSGVFNGARQVLELVVDSKFDARLALSINTLVPKLVPVDETLKLCITSAEGKSMWDMAPAGMQVGRTLTKAARKMMQNDMGLAMVTHWSVLAGVLTRPLLGSLVMAYISEQRSVWRRQTEWADIIPAILSITSPVMSRLAREQASAWWERVSSLTALSPIGEMADDAVGPVRRLRHVLAASPDTEVHISASEAGAPALLAAAVLLQGRSVALCTGQGLVRERHPGYRRDSWAYVYLGEGQGQQILFSGPTMPFGFARGPADMARVGGWLALATLRKCVVQTVRCSQLCQRALASGPCAELVERARNRDPASPIPDWLARWVEAFGELAASDEVRRLFGLEEEEACESEGDVDPKGASGWWAAALARIERGSESLGPHDPCASLSLEHLKEFVAGAVLLVWASHWFEPNTPVPDSVGGLGWFATRSLQLTVDSWDGRALLESAIEWVLGSKPPRKDVISCVNGLVVVMGPVRDLSRGNAEYKHSIAVFDGECIYEGEVYKHVVGTLDPGYSPVRYVEPVHHALMPCLREGYPVMYVVSATPYTDSLRLNIMWRDGSGRPHMFRADAPLLAAMEALTRRQLVLLGRSDDHQITEFPCRPTFEVPTASAEKGEMLVCASHRSDFWRWVGLVSGSDLRVYIQGAEQYSSAVRTARACEAQVLIDGIVSQGGGPAVRHERGD